MATRNIVPRADNQGSIGTTIKRWLAGYFYDLYITNDLGVPEGGTGKSSCVAYCVQCGGTTTTGAQQSVASVGSSGQVLTSNGAATLPTFQNAPNRNYGIDMVTNQANYLL